MYVCMYVSMYVCMYVCMYNPLGPGCTTVVDFGFKINEKTTQSCTRLCVHENVQHIMKN